MPTTRIDARLDVLRAYAAGWLDGEGVALAPVVDALAPAVRRIAYALPPGAAYIYPLPEGGLCVEWDGRAPGRVDVLRDGGNPLFAGCALRAGRMVDLKPTATLDDAEDFARRMGEE